MRSRATSLRTLWVACGVVAATVVALPLAVDAGAVPTVLGTVDCEPTTGEQIITWRWANSTSEVLNFDSGVADPAGLTAGTLASDVVGMLPDLGLALGAEAVGETIASADAVGTLGVTLVWFRTDTQGTLQVTGEVLLFGDCVLPETTAVVTDTTTPGTVPEVVVDSTLVGTPQPTSAVGSGSEALPHAGSDPTLLFLGGGLVLVGGVLLVVRRRTHIPGSAEPY